MAYDPEREFARRELLQEYAIREARDEAALWKSVALATLLAFFLLLGALVLLLE